MGGDPEHVLEGHPQHDPQHDLLSTRLAPVAERLHHMNGGPLEERHTHAGKMSCAALRGKMSCAPLLASCHTTRCCATMRFPSCDHF